MTSFWLLETSLERYITFCLGSIRFYFFVLSCSLVRLSCLQILPVVVVLILESHFEVGCSLLIFHGLGHHVRLVVWLVLEATLVRCLVVIGGACSQREMVTFQVLLHAASTLAACYACVCACICTSPETHSQMQVHALVVHIDFFVNGRLCTITDVYTCARIHDCLRARMGYGCITLIPVCT